MHNSTGNSRPDWLTDAQDSITNAATAVSDAEIAEHRRTADQAVIDEIRIQLMHRLITTAVSEASWQHRVQPTRQQ